MKNPGRHAGIEEKTRQLSADSDGGPRRLVISSDFYAVYQAAGKKADGLVNLYCWAQYAEPGIMRNLPLGRRCSPGRRLFRAVGC